MLMSPLHECKFYEVFHACQIYFFYRQKKLNFTNSNENKHDFFASQQTKKLNSKQKLVVLVVQRMPTN